MSEAFKSLATGANPSGDVISNLKSQISNPVAGKARARSSSSSFRRGEPSLTLSFLLALGIAAGQPLPAVAQGPAFAVLISHRVSNTGDEPAKDVTAVCILPASNRYQEVIDRQIDPAPEETRKDAEGQEIITVPLGEIPPGQTRSVRVVVWARIRAIRVDLLGPGGKPTTLPAEIEQAQLADGYLLQLDKIKPIAEKNAGAERRDIDRARKAYEYMLRECVYDIDEKFEPADRILAGSPASCSELAYTYLAMCRALNVPARIVSAYVNRGGASPSTDWRTHRWVEFYTKEYGWIPADPTNRLNDTSKTFFGHQDGKYLTVLDDGLALDDRPDPAWRVFIAGSESGGAGLRTSRSAVWRVSAHRPTETESFKKACAALRSDDTDARRQAVQAWTRQRETLTHGYLLEALFDPDLQIRKEAAAALGKCNDQSMLIPLAILAEKEKDEALKEIMLAAAARLLSAPNPAERAQAVAELARSRTPEALQLLDGIWNDQAREVRKVAAQSLYKFGDKPVIHKAYRMLVNDPDEFIRVFAALRWARIGTRDAEPFLVDLLESQVRWDREHALRELARRSGNEFGFDPAVDSQRKSNREALTRWREWLARPEAATTQAAGP